jgi:outer membrane protein assembly factor BamB
MLARLAIACCCLTVVRAFPATAQDAKQATPAEWVQLRGGLDNRGVVPGTLEVRWRFKAPYTVRAISVANGHVIFGTDVTGGAVAPRPGIEGKDTSWIGVLRVADGTLEWSRRVPRWVHSDAVTDGRRVFVTNGQLPEHLFGGLTAYDLRTGDSLWSVLTSGGVMTAAAIDAKSATVSFVGADGCLQTLKTANGQPVRSWCLGGSVLMSSPRIDDENGDVIVGGGVLTHNRVVAVNVRTGRESWRTDLSSYHAMSDIPVAMTKDMVYTVGSLNASYKTVWKALPASDALHLMREAQKAVGLGKRDEWFERQWLIALDRKTGKERWRRPLGFGLMISRNHSGSPVVVDSTVFVTSPVTRTLWAFNAATGRLRWTRDLGALQRGSPTAIDSLLLVGDSSGRLSLFRQGDGELVGQCQAAAGFTVTQPILVGKTIFAATRDGWVHVEPYTELRARMTLAAAVPSCFP